MNTEFFVAILGFPPTAGLLCYCRAYGYEGKSRYIARREALTVASGAGIVSLTFLVLAFLGSK